MIKVEQIIEKYGWPKAEIIGYDNASVLWYVLHHQVDVKIRDKYEKLIEQNMQEGAIEAYKSRSRDIKNGINDKLY